MNEYKDERDILEKDIKALEGKSATYSGVRFVMFLAALAGLIIGIYDNRVTVLILGIIAAVAFVAMVFIHGKLSEELEYKKAKSEVLRRYIERFGDGWKKFEDNGAQYLGDDDLVARDMATFLDRALCISLSVLREPRREKGLSPRVYAIRSTI